MELTLYRREGTGKGANRKLKAAGNIPAIIYGGKENIAVYTSSSKLSSFFTTTKGKAQIIDLNIGKEGAVEKKKAVIQDYQYSTIKKRFIHVDFLEVKDETNLSLEIPINTVGTSKAVKMGGIMQVIRHSIPVHCKAKDIPESIEIDVSELDFGSSIHVLDIAYPQGVKPVVTGRNFTLITTSDAEKEEVVEETIAEEATEEEKADPAKKDAKAEAAEPASKDAKK